MDFVKILHKAAGDAFESGIFVPDNDGKNTDWEIYLIKLGISLAVQEQPNAVDAKCTAPHGEMLASGFEACTDCGVKLRH